MAAAFLALSSASAFAPAALVPTRSRGFVSPIVGGIDFEELDYRLTEYFPSQSFAPSLPAAAAAELALFVYVGIELTLHVCAFFFVNEATKLFNIYFDTILFSYLSWTKKGETDQKLYTFFAIQHLFFLFVKFVSPSLYLQIFETKHMIPVLYYMATLFECVAYVNMMIQMAMRNIPTILTRVVKNMRQSSSSETSSKTEIRKPPTVKTSRKGKKDDQPPPTSIL